MQGLLESFNATGRCQTLVPLNSRTTNRNRAAKLADRALCGVSGGFFQFLVADKLCADFSPTNYAMHASIYFSIDDGNS